MWTLDSLGQAFSFDNSSPSEVGRLHRRLPQVMKVWVDLLVYLLSSFFFDKIPTWQILAFSSLLLSWKEGHVQPGKDEVEDLDLYRCSVPNSSDGPIFEKRRATDGHFFNKNTGVKTGVDGQNSSFCF